MVSGPGFPTVVAAKIGYRVTGVEIYELPQDDVELVLDYAAPPTTSVTPMVSRATAIRRTTTTPRSVATATPAT